MEDRSPPNSGASAALMAPTGLLPPVLSAQLPGELICCVTGVYQRIARPARDFWPEYEQFATRANERAAPRHWLGSERAQRAVGVLAAAHPHRTVFLDIETCGMRGAPVFLIGLFLPGRSSTLLQLFARGTDEEATILAALEEHLTPDSLLVTFNGKSFDWPFIRDRRAWHGLTELACADHVDLLHLARRKWRGTVRNHRLQTLEVHVCGRQRVDDLGGWEIPRAYQAYLRTGQLHDIHRILLHNALDVLTMVHLTSALLGTADAMRATAAVSAPVAPPAGVSPVMPATMKRTT